MDEWDLENADPTHQVGARHHIVPAFYLRRFANSQNQLWVRDRRSPMPGLRKESDLAIRDFYTFQDLHGDPDGRMEQVLQKIEDRAASALRRVTSAVTWGRPIRPEDKTDLCVFTAFQYVRGLRKRREIELMSDFYVRVMQLNDPVGAGRREAATYREMLRDFRTLEVTSHPNEHVSLLGELAEPLSNHLLHRPLIVVELTNGALITCDEPVVTFDDQEDTPDPVIAQARQRTRSRRRRGQREIRQTRTLIQVQSTRNRGLARVDEIVLPVGRRTLLVFSHPAAAGPSHLRITREEGHEVAEEVNKRMLAQAYFMAFAHPDDRHLLAESLPEVGPLYRLGGVHPEQARVAGAAPSHLRPELFGRR
ncbi:DUF4238 domain-containing protein [Streptomyces sp. 378]|uniref:DUF4238 domain-containing protein n=1 Tax=Streptomyces sp. 378 TaxID=3049412 RepID=UPI0024C307A4|nr:DUF4238 domain-containing protein [Streptomyces sp. 378]MDK1342052.1 DUF4238 domain-containing protein [Streptomyces sp. 378]